MLATTMLAIIIWPSLAAASGPWEHIGPYNIFDDYRGKGESGTLACAASPKAHPNIIYAGGQNNGVSSGILKTTDAGTHWIRKSKGLFDTRVLGVWVHPDDASGAHVFVGTHTGIYESVDGAESWALRNETKTWGSVMSFRAGQIGSEPYILANAGSGFILTMPRAGGLWQRIAAPGGIANNAHLSVVTPPGQESSEVLTCVGGWGGGQLYYGKLESPTTATWQGPLMTPSTSYGTWDSFPATSLVWGRCRAPDTCSDGVQPLGPVANLTACRAAVNATAPHPIAAFTYMHNTSSNKEFAAHCFVITDFKDIEAGRHAQADTDSGRAPGFFPGGAVDCANAAVDPNDRDHFLYSKGGRYNLWESKDGGRSVQQVVNFTSAAYFVVIDQQGWFFTATQAGAFRSTDGGGSWKALNVHMETRSGRVINRVPHDYQRIVPDFREGQIALPSDQGLHIVNGSELNLTSACGDLRNNMALSAIISPSRQARRARAARAGKPARPAAAADRARVFVRTPPLLAGRHAQRDRQPVGLGRGRLVERRQDLGGLARGREVAGLVRGGRRWSGHGRVRQDHHVPPEPLVELARRRPQLAPWQPTRRRGELRLPPAGGLALGAEWHLLLDSDEHRGAQAGLCQGG